ncbi:MAG: hypothetical protein IK122_00925, partial [Alphaproteobacteria bacterium]|nr:hypothetical protein [Alphaproteobacteria bacterium]
MNTDTTTLICGSIFSVLLAQIDTTGMNDYSILELLKGFSASGVLAVTYWWIMQRFEKRLDAAFKDYKELIVYLIKKEKENK